MILNISCFMLGFLFGALFIIIFAVLIADRKEIRNGKNIRKQGSNDFNQSNKQS